MKSSKTTYSASRIIAGIVCAIGLGVIGVSITYWALGFLVTNPIQAAVYGSSGIKVLIWGMCLGFLILAFGLLCRAVFDIADSISIRKQDVMPPSD